MGRGPIPERWLDYKPIGRQIEGTRFIAFKVPLSTHVCETIDDAAARHDIGKVLRAVPNLGLVIDLTNTLRYYDSAHFSRYGVQYAKLKVPGHVIPPEKLRVEFGQIVRDFLRRNKHNDKVIGVHCTHGVNRTGFFICDHMISELAMDPKDAVKRFEVARGHHIERQNYLTVLHNRVEKNSNDVVEHKRDSRRYSRNGNEEYSNRKERSADLPTRRFSQNNDTARPFQRSSNHERVKLPASRPSYNEERSSNTRNPFRREPLWPTSTIPESATDDKRPFRKDFPPKYNDVVRENLPTHSRFSDERRPNDPRNPFKKDASSFASYSEKGHTQHHATERNSEYYRVPPRQYADSAHTQSSSFRKIPNRPTSMRGDTDKELSQRNFPPAGRSEDFRKRNRFSNDSRNERSTETMYDRSIHRDNNSAPSNNWRSNRFEYKNKSDVHESRDSKYSSRSFDTSGSQDPKRRGSKSSNGPSRNFRSVRS